MLVSIDPGEATGWAVWHGCLLATCGLAPSDLPVVDRPAVVWIERPMIYPRSKARPNDIVTLAVNAGEWGGRFAAFGAQVNYVTPAAWKGQVPKAIHHTRIWSALTPGEQDRVAVRCGGVAPSKRHNVMDAIGLGLWALRGSR